MTIAILDEIQLPADAMASVLARFDETYLPAARARGLTLAGRWQSPPLPVAGQGQTLWLQWTLPDVLAFYGSRAGQDASVAAFWREVDGVALHRRRHVMTAAGEAPAQQETAP